MTTTDDGTSPADHSAPAEPVQKVVVIGAGIAGLATAGLLARDGYDVTLIDRNDEVGGRAGSLSVDGFRWDTGPSWYLMPEAFDHFFELMGTSTTEMLDLVTLDPSYRLFPEGLPPVDVPHGVEGVATLFETIEPGSGEVLRDYLAEAQETYRLAVDRFLYTTYSSVGAAVKAVTAPTSGLDRTAGSLLARLRTLSHLLTTPLADHVAARVTDRRLRQILSYPAVFLAGRPERIPALYHLMSHTDLAEGVVYPKGGFAAVVAAMEQLAERAGVRILRGVEVEKIDTVWAGGVRAGVAGRRVTGVRARRLDGSMSQRAADIVVSCGDAHHTDTTLLRRREASRSPRAWRKRNPGLSVVGLMLGVRGELPELAHHSLLFSEKWDPDFDAVFRSTEPGSTGPDGLERPHGASRSLYVNRVSATEPEAVAPEGHEALFVLVPCPADPEIGRGNAYLDEESVAVREIADATISLIGTRLGIADFADRVVVRRTLGPGDFSERYHAWQGTAFGLAHTLRQSAFLRGRTASSTVAGLYYAGAMTAPGVGVPMCLISAENVVKAVRGDTSHGRLDPATLG